MRHKPKPFDVPGLTRVERLRRLQGWTLRDLEQRTGIAKSTLQRAMLGYFPDVRDGIRIARSMDVTVEDIWGDEVIK